MRKVVFVLLAAIFVSYLVYEGRGLIFSPALNLFSPPEDFRTNNRMIEVSGQTDPGAQVAINDTPVLPDEKGFFQEKLVLQDGLNILKIQATKRYARPRVIERTVLVNQEQKSLTYTYGQR